MAFGFGGTIGRAEIVMPLMTLPGSGPRAAQPAVGAPSPSLFAVAVAIADLGGGGVEREMIAAALETTIGRATIADVLVVVVVVIGVAALVAAFVVVSTLTCALIVRSAIGSGAGDASKDSFCSDGPSIVIASRKRAKPARTR